MGWKLVVVLLLAVLWIIWPKIRIPKENYLRRKLGAFGTYFLVIICLIALIQLLDYLLSRVQ